MASFRQNMNFLRRLKPFYRRSLVHAESQQDQIVIISRYSASRTKNRNTDDQARDPFLVFMRTDVQTILTKLRGFDPERIFHAYKANRPTKPKYKVLTDEEVQKEYDEKVNKRAWMRLQMPPFMQERKSREVIRDDPDIALATDSKIVFVDISWKNKRIMGNNTRPAVCRHPDGKLTYVDWDTVDRVCQMFNPVPGREIFMPKMFEKKYLEEILKRKDIEYRYILERACVQFEPDSEHFIRVSRRIYEEIAKHKQFDELWSTRFYGPMVFYFCWVKSIGPLLQHLIENDKMVNGALLVKLYSIVNPELRLKAAGKAINIVQQYVDYAKIKKMKGWKDLQQLIDDAQPQRVEGSV